MWETKIFKTKKQMNNWIEKNKSKIQFEEIFIENGFAVEYRKLRVL